VGVDLLPRVLHVLLFVGDQERGDAGGE
jgi:hypothetical protein